MYCSICIEVCPFDALHWSPEFAYAEGDIKDLTHDMNRLREWMGTVPPPQALDPGAEQGKELQAYEAARERRRRHRDERSPSSSSSSSRSSRPAPRCWR